jgi:hypothetical protein
MDAIGDSVRRVEAHAMPAAVAATIDHSICERSALRTVSVAYDSVDVSPVFIAFAALLPEIIPHDPIIAVVAFTMLV